MGNSSIHEHDHSYKKNYSDQFKEFKVQAVDLDTHLSNCIGHKVVDFLKIDIEGGEYHAFLGMQGMIKQNKIKTVVFELNKGMLQNDWKPFIELLNQFRNNYNKEFFTLNNGGEKVPISIEGLESLQGHPHVVMI
nr:FkbM family methyltransferase [Desulforamulus aquiferis]